MTSQTSQTSQTSILTAELDRLARFVRVAKERTDASLSLLDVDTELLRGDGIERADFYNIARHSLGSVSGILLQVGILLRSQIVVTPPSASLRECVGCGSIWDDSPVTEHHLPGCPIEAWAGTNKIAGSVPAALDPNDFVYINDDTVSSSGPPTTFTTPSSPLTSHPMMQPSSRLSWSKHERKGRVMDDHAVMRQMHRYALHLSDQPQAIDLPCVGAVRHVGWSCGRLNMWVESNIHANSVTRVFGVYSDDQPLPTGSTYIGTAINGVYIVHVFEWRDHEAKQWLDERGSHD